MWIRNRLKRRRKRQSFNRYMVECESYKFVTCWKCTWVLIDTWWNVNFCIVCWLVIIALVLIDTWWNVNVKRGVSFFWSTRVLIDTWWNVNGDADQTGYVKIEVLIDTWWNVNTQTRKRIALHHIVLIDTWWNVNENANLAFMEIFGFNRYMVECESNVLWLFYNIIWF